MKHYFETYNHTRMRGASFSDIEELKEYFEDRWERDHEVVLDVIQVNGISLNMDDLTTPQQLKRIEEIQEIKSEDLALVEMVRSHLNTTWEDAMTQVYEGYRVKLDELSDEVAFQEYYEEINYSLKESIPEVWLHINWKSLMETYTINYIDMFNYGTTYLFINK